MFVPEYKQTSKDFVYKVGKCYGLFDSDVYILSIVITSRKPISHFEIFHMLEELGFTREFISDRLKCLKERGFVREESVFHKTFPVRVYEPTKFVEKQMRKEEREFKRSFV